MNFKTINIKDIEGNSKETTFDYKGLADYIYNTSKSISGLELARELHKNGAIELEPEQAQIVRDSVKECFGAVVHEALFPVLDEIINQNK